MEDITMFFFSPENIIFPIAVSLGTKLRTECCDLPQESNSPTNYSDSYSVQGNVPKSSHAMDMEDCKYLLFP